MSIYVNKDTRVIVQGITGKQGAFHAEKMIELKAASKLKRIIVAEHNYGQMVLEVERVVKDNCKIDFVGKWNGSVITPAEILAKIEEA